MARVYARSPAENSLLNPNVTLSRRFAATSGEDPGSDLFLDFASEADSRNLQGFDTPQKPSSETPAMRGSARNQLDTSALSSPTITNGIRRTDRFPSRPSLPAARADSLRDPSSDQASVSSNDYHPQAQRSIPVSSGLGRRTTNLGSSPSELRSNTTRDSNGLKRSDRYVQRPSNLSHETRKPQESGYISNLAEAPTLSPALQSNADTAESVGSTTAPSTVWDELEELRQRIRRLEFDGNRVVKSGVATADENNDRPHTATTMTTTSSISNAGKRNITYPTYSPPPLPPPHTEASPSYNLLRAALQKAKSSVHADVYRFLEASISEALEIAASIPKSTSHSLVREQDPSLSNPASLRRLRRKSESVCRSLTELCIALCEDSARQSLRHAPWDNLDSPVSQSFSGNEYTPLNSREGRKTWLDRASMIPNRPTSRTSEYAASSTAGDDATSTADRKSLISRLSRSRRSGGLEDDASYTTPRSHSRATTYLSREDSEDRDPTIRAPSRAMSELNYARQGSMRDQIRDAQKFSREYTARHPLPDPPTAAFQSQSGTTPTSYSLQNTPRTQNDDHQTPNSDLPARNTSRQSTRSTTVSSALAERLEARRQRQVTPSAPFGSTPTSSATEPSRARSASRTNRLPSGSRSAHYTRDLIGT